MCSSIGSVINSILEFRSGRFFECCHTLILTGDSSYDILGNVSYPFFSAKTKNTVIGYLLECPVPWFKKLRVLFYNYCVFARVQIKNGNILLLHGSLFISSSTKESKKFSRNFPALGTCKTSKFVIKNFAVNATDPLVWLAHWCGI